MIRWTSNERPSGARLIVGLSVRGHAPLTVEYAIAAWSTSCRERGMRVDATFASGRGLYTYDDGTEVSEDSVTITVLNTCEDPTHVFRRNILAIAEVMAELLGQEEIIVELFGNGRVHTVLGIGSEPEEKQHAAE